MTVVQFIHLWSYPTIVISVMSYCFFQYWWSVLPLCHKIPAEISKRVTSITTLIPDAYEQYGPAIQGALLLGLLVGLLVAELLCSGHLSDKIMVILTKRNNGKRVPEMRLWLGLPAAVLSSIGLLLWGLSIDGGWHWMTGQVAFFFCKASRSLV